MGTPSNGSKATAASTVSFADALAALKSGKKVVKKSWNNELPAAEGDKSGKKKYSNWLQIVEAGESEVIANVTNGNVNTYGLNSADALAEDWIIL